jgi:hypothetical protein
MKWMGNGGYYIKKWSYGLWHPQWCGRTHTHKTFHLSFILSLSLSLSHTHTHTKLHASFGAFIVVMFQVKVFWVVMCSVVGYQYSRGSCWFHLHPKDGGSIELEHVVIFQVEVFWVVMPCSVVVGYQCFKRSMLPPSSLKTSTWYITTCSNSMYTDFPEKLVVTQLVKKFHHWALS